MYGERIELNSNSKIIFNIMKTTQKQVLYGIKYSIYFFFIM
jgi:hypothetical protein